MNESPIISPTKRRRGRPKKKNTNVTAINKFPTFTPQTSYKRKASPDVEIISLNGDIPKKAKSDDDQPKRLQPPRRARFTESYGGNADVVMVSASDDDSESDSDSDCSPIPSPVPKIRSKEEQEEYDSNIERLKKALGDEEMKLVLLRKLKESQKSKRESTASPLPTALVSHKQQQPVMLKGGVQIQPLPSKQLLAGNKYLANKRDKKPEAISNPNSILKQSQSAQFKPIQPQFKANQQPPYKPVKQEPSSTISSSSVEQLNSNHLNQYPLLKNLSNQITITAVPPPTTSSNGSTSRHHHQQQQQQQQQLQDEKNDAETLQQRQAAAKLALRKQLEKTLLQIPLPKPPPLKINFYPAPNSIEFLCLMGLDFVVDFLVQRSKLEKSEKKDPLRCAQCSTDFTAAWKWKEVEKNGSKVYDVFCEACITSNIRKGLKAQHTNNLKSAFLKALQQEKEIDRLTIHSLPKLPKVPAQRETPKSSHSSSSRHNRHSDIRQPSPAHQGVSTSAFSIPKAAMAMPYIPKGQGMNHAALAQLSKLSPQYQSLLQAQAQQLLAAGVPLHPGVLSLSPFMTPIPNHHHGRQKSSSSSGSRHYRSDRQSPNVPHTSRH